MRTEKVYACSRLARGALVAFLAIVALFALNMQSAFAADDDAISLDTKDKLAVSVFNEMTTGPSVSMTGYVGRLNTGTAAAPVYSFKIPVNPQARDLAAANRPTVASISMWARQKGNTSGDTLRIPATEGTGANAKTNWTYDPTTGTVTILRIPKKAWTEPTGQGEYARPPIEAEVDINAGFSIYAELTQAQVTTNDKIDVYAIEVLDGRKVPDSVFTGRGTITAPATLLTATKPIIKDAPWNLSTTTNQVAYHITPDSSGPDAERYNVAFSVSNGLGGQGYQKYKPEKVVVYSITKDGSGNIISMLQVPSSFYTYTAATGDLTFASDMNVFGDLLVVSAVTTLDGLQPVKSVGKTGNTITIRYTEGQRYFYSNSKDGPWLEINPATTPRDEHGNLVVSGLAPDTKYYFYTSANGVDSAIKNWTTEKEGDSVAAERYMPWEQGKEWTGRAVVRGWHSADGTDPYSGEVAYQTWFTVELYDFPTGTYTLQDDAWITPANPSGEREYNNIGDMFTDGGVNDHKYYPAMCRNHAGAETPSGYDGVCDLKCTKVTKDAAYFEYTFGYHNPNFDAMGLQKMYGRLDLAQELPIEIEVTKKEFHPEISNATGESRNEEYSLAGAEFKIYGPDDESSLAATVTTDESGKARAKDLKAGTYLVVETKAPNGFALEGGPNESVKETCKIRKSVSGDPGDEVEVEFTDYEQTGIFEIEKFDKQTTESFAQGDGTLEGIVYRIEFFGGSYNTPNEARSATGIQKKVWYLKTIYDPASGETKAMAKFDHDHLVSNLTVDGHSYASDAFYESQEGGVVCPLGTYVVTEFYVPGETGYNKTDDQEHLFRFYLDDEQRAEGTSNKITFDMAKEGHQNGDPAAYKEITEFYNIVMKGEIELIKVDDTVKTYKTGKTGSADNDSQGNADLSGAVFAIINRSHHYVLSPVDGRTKIQPGQVVCTITTDKNGFATTAKSHLATNGWGSWPTISNDDNTEWTHALAYGNYEAFEIQAPLGYLLGHYEGNDVTYYSLVTKNAKEPLSNSNPYLSSSTYSTFKLLDGSKAFKGTDIGNTYVTSATVKKNVPNEKGQTATAHRSWIDCENAVVSFDKRNASDDLGPNLSEIWYEDTVKRADIELDKADDTLNTTPTDQVVDYAGRTNPQGDASVKDACFAIINRSQKAVVNPFGQLVMPGHIVCFIFTDENGHASTKLTAERIKINRWDQIAVNGAVDGKNYAAGPNIYAVQKKWHGALAYGEYEVFEVEAPEGYLNGHWFNDIQTKWAAMAVKNGASNNMASIAGTGEFKNAFRTDYPEQFKLAYINDSASPEWYRIYANSPHKWIEVDNFEWYKENGKAEPYYPSLNSDKDEVQFTQDALKNGSTHKSSLDSYVNHAQTKKEQRFEDTVMRGNLDLQKVDEDFESSQNSSIGNTIEDKNAISGTGNPELDGKNPITIANGRGHLEGAVFGIYNRSKTVVVSPVTGKEVQPGGLVCKIITNTYGYASTELTPENIRYNEWDRQYENGIKEYANGTCFATENGWHGALAYGQYEVVEITPPTGYLMNKTWHGMATKNVGEVDNAENHTFITANTELKAIIDSSSATELQGKGVKLADKAEVKPNGSKNWDWASDHRGWITQTNKDSLEYPSNYPLADKKTAPAISRLHSYKGVVNNVRSTYTNKSQSTWINEDKVLICFGTVQEDHYAQGGTSTGNRGTENLNASSVYASNVKGGPLATDTKTDNDQVWVEDAIVRGGVKIGKIDRQNQQYKEQGKGSLENHIIGIFSTNPNPVTVYQMDEVNQNWTNTKTVSGVTITQNGKDSTESFDMHIIDPSVVPEQIEANSVGIYGSKYQDKRSDGKISWTYPGWIKKDKAQDYMSMSAFVTRPFPSANADAFFPGVYFYWPDQGAVPEFGKQTADGVFIGYITTRKVVEADGTVKYVAQTDADTLPYGTYTLREMYVPSSTGYVFDEVSMSWHESFGIGDDFAYVEQDLNSRYKDNSNYYGMTVASDKLWYKDQMTDKNGWFWHETDYRFQADYKKNNGANDSTRGMDLYYYTATSDASKVFDSTSSAYYLPGAYHNRYKEVNTGVPIDGDYYHRVVPSDAHDLSLNNKFVDFTEAGVQKTNGEKNYRFAISNYIRRGDIVFTKTNAESDRLAGVPFLITSKTTGESHIVYTDDNGSYDSRQANEYPIRAHSYHTNENDAALTQKSAAGIPYLTKTTSSAGTDSYKLTDIAKFDDNGYWVDSAGKTPALDWDYGLWFHGRVDAITIHPQIHSSGASSGNPLDFFTDFGVPNRDMQKELNQNGYLGNEPMYVDNPAIAAYNPLYVATTGTSVFQSPLGALPYDDYIIQELKVPAREVVKNNHTYQLPDTGDYLMISAAQFSIDHQADPETTEMVYSTYPGGILRTSFNAGANTKYAVHDDLELVNNIIRIGTTLSTVKWPDIKHQGDLKTDTTLYDHVKYEGVTRNHDYYMVGELYFVTTGADGKAQVSEQPLRTVGQNKEYAFNSGKDTMGEIDVVFEFDSKELKPGDSLVAFEYLYDASTNEVVAKHTEPSDKGQTVSYQDMHTTLTDSDGDKEVAAYKEVKLIDHVYYAGLIPGETYTFSGVLHLKEYDENGNAVDGGAATDENGNPITATKEVTIETRDGVVDIEFTFMAPNLAGKTVVAFENIQPKDGDFMVHAKIDDEEQTVYFPEIGTTALDGVTGDHIGLANEDVTLEDVVEYKNLVKGKTYTINGTLMDQGTGEPIKVAGGENITGSYTFIAGYVKKTNDANGVASIADLKSALNKAEGISSVSAEELAALSENLTKAFDENKDTLTEEKVVEILDGAKTALGDAVKDIDFDALKTAAKAYFKELAETGSSSSWVEDEESTSVKFNDEITLVSGKVKVPFTMKGDDIRGKAIVVFERLYNQPDNPEPEGDHEVEISKTDVATSKELPGATLIVTDSDGLTVARWVSGDTPKKIKLDEGTYTLTEYTAPKGYTVTESIEFKVDSKGLVGGEKIEMKNASKDIPEGDHEVEISKTDATTSKELPGATLIVQDSTGTTVEQWVSGDTPKKIKLSEGTYKLIEITAPDGYARAEAIEFKVDSKGLVNGEKVEMKDALSSDEPVAIHEDINDSNQQVNYPDIGTRALLNNDESFAASEAAGKDIAIVDDVVAYTNLIPGRTYTIDGVIMDKVTGQPAVQSNGQEIHSQVTFTPETASGEVFVKFTFEADIFTELQHDLVVFENAYMMRDGVEDNFIHVGKHEDINDLNQTVPWEDLPDDWPKTPIQHTGDDMPFMPLLITIGVAMGAAGAFGLRRRFTK